ncbi:MAG: C39 family peptidase [Patescibacteria group bacterium]
MKKKVIHIIPFFSQRSSHEWQERGFKDKEHALQWENRVCGIACMKMVFNLHDKYKDQLFASLIEEMEEKGVYKLGVGCIHHKIAKEFNDRGIDAGRMKIEDIQEFKRYIDQDNIFIVSIGPAFIDNQKTGHLVPVIGYVEEDGKIISLIVHHTSSYGEREWEAVEIDVEKFTNHFSGNTIRVRLYNA